MAETRTDLLIVQPASSKAFYPLFYFTLLRCDGGTVHRHGPLCLWVGDERELFLPPDPLGDNREDQCFALKNGVRPVKQP